jgi:hypothetical protein
MVLIRAEGSLLLQVLGRRQMVMYRHRRWVVRSEAGVILVADVEEEAQWILLEI